MSPVSPCSISPEPDSPSCPAWFSFLEERRHALAEIGARIAHLDQVAVFAGLEAALRHHAAHHLFRRAKGQRCVRRQLERELTHDLLDLARACDAGQETEPV